MKLRQVHAHDSVLETGQDPIPDEFVVWHAAVEGMPTGRHSRSKNHIGLVAFQGLEQLRQGFRRVLTIGVKHYNYVQAFLYGVLITFLLIAAVSQVFRITMQSELLHRINMLVPDCGEISVVGRTIIEEEDLFDFVPYLFRYAIESPIKLVYSIISYYEYPNSLCHKHLPSCSPSTRSTIQEIRINGLCPLPCASNPG